MINDNTSFIMVKELCFYHNKKLNYGLRNELYSSVANEKNWCKNCPFYHTNVNLHSAHIQPTVKPM